MEFVNMNDYRNKDIFIIYFEWWAGNCNMGFWTGECNGEIQDYHTKEALIEMAERMGKEWIVFRHHKGKLRPKVSISARGGKKLN